MRPTSSRLVPPPEREYPQNDSCRASGPVATAFHPNSKAGRSRSPAVAPALRWREQHGAYLSRRRRPLAGRRELDDVALASVATDASRWPATWCRQKYSESRSTSCAPWRCPVRIAFERGRLLVHRRGDPGPGEDPRLKSSALHEAELHHVGPVLRSQERGQGECLTFHAEAQGIDARLVL